MTHSHSPITEMEPDAPYVLKANHVSRLTCRPQGIIFGPDVHADERGPSTRMDNYGQTILSKLTQIMSVANAENRIAVFPGDFMGRSRVNSDYIKSQIMKILQMSQFRPIIYPGNHDMSADYLSEQDSLYLFQASGVAHVQRFSGETVTVEMEDSQTGQTRIVGIGGTPYGQDIPDSATFSLADGRRADLGVWFTHHNLPFSQHYEDQTIYGFKGISGVHTVINGHLHHPSPSVRQPVERAGHFTDWHNPGSVTQTNSNERASTPTYGIIDPAGDISNLPLILDGGESVFSAAAGRASAPNLSKTMSDEARTRLIDGLVMTEHEQDSVGVLLDKAVSKGELDQATRDWLEQIAVKTMPA